MMDYPTDWRVTVDGPETPEALQVADQLRAMIATHEPGHGPNRAERRRAAAKQRHRR